MGRYQFSDDWFNRHVPLFSRYLGGLRDRPCRLLEIGSYEGRSLVWLLENVVTHRESRIDSVDIREHPRLMNNLAATGARDKVAFNLGRSAAVLRTLPPDSYDFAYIDGCHWAVETLEDAVLSFPLVKAGGIIAFDDYLWDDPAMNEFGRPKEAVDAFLAIYDGHVDVLHRGWQVWLRKRPAHEVERLRLRPLHWQPSWLRHPRKALRGLISAGRSPQRHGGREPALFRRPEASD